MTPPKIGSRWRHKKTKRIAVVVSMSNNDRMVYFRYTAPVRVTRAHHLLRPRVNTTPQALSSFLEAFAAAEEGWEQS